MLDPYRTSARPAALEPRALDDGGWACGELTIASLLAGVGALGVALGLSSSSVDCELSIGVLLLLLGMKVFVDERRWRAHRRARSRVDR